MPGESDRGRFVWYDLMTTDPEAAKAFYTAVTGWGTHVWETPGMPPYTMWTVGEKPIGGTMKLPAAAGAGPHWLAYVGVPDVDATTARARELGATVMSEPRDIPTVGRFAILKDPQGATIAAFTPDPSSQRPPEPEGTPPVGEFSWHELITPDPDAALAFYGDLFGWEKTGEHDMGPMGRYQMYGRNGKTLGGMFRKPAEMPEPLWLYYARVADINAAVKAGRQQGGKVLLGPMEVPGGGLVATFMDPQGGAFAVHQSKPA